MKMSLLFSFVCLIAFVGIFVAGFGGLSDGYSVGSGIISFASGLIAFVCAGFENKWWDQ